MKSLSVSLNQQIRYQLRNATKQSYVLDVETAGNILPYRNYMASSMAAIHGLLSFDSSEASISLAVINLWSGAPRFD